MTCPAHRHRIIRVQPESRIGKILFTTLTTSTDTDRVEKSRWMWGLDPEPLVLTDGTLVTRYRLRVLGVLHTLIGLTWAEPRESS